MHRGLLLSLAFGLLSVLVGCQHHCRGRCDCLVYPLDHGTPSPIHTPGPNAAPPLQPVAPIPAP